MVYPSSCRSESVHGAPVDIASACPTELAAAVGDNASFSSHGNNHLRLGCGCFAKWFNSRMSAGVSISAVRCKFLGLSGESTHSLTCE